MKKKWGGYPRYRRRRGSGLCGILERRFLRRRVDPGLRRQNGRLWRSANEAFGMSPMSFEKDLAPSSGELFGAAIVNVGRCHKADSRVPVVKIVVIEEADAEQSTVLDGTKTAGELRAILAS